MRIGFDVNPAVAHAAGAGRYAAGLLAHLHEVDGVTVEHLRFEGGPGRSRVGRLARSVAREAAYYPFILGWQARRRRVDLVHCPAPLAPVFLDRPLVLTLHDVLPWRYPALFTLPNVLYSRLAVTRAARRARRIVVGSEYVRGDVVEVLRVPPERVVVTRYGIDHRFRPTEPDPAWLSQRFGVRPPFILAVGTREPRKNLATVLEAFARAARELPDLTLVVVGQGGWKNEAFERRLRQSDGSIVLTGYVSDDDLVRLYGSAACFVFPSLYEGFGLPPLEAMACGTPVIASDRTSLPEVLGDAAILVEPTDADGLAAAVVRVVNSAALANELRRSGLERSRLFSWRTCARETADVYRQALAD